MADHSFQDIAVEDLFLDLNNPRHDILNDQNEAIREMIVDQGDKLIKLAQDIIEQGINPSELTIVTPSNVEEQRYIVLEGNRRVAAIKLLLNPSLAQAAGDLSVTKFFTGTSKEFRQKPITHLRSVIFEQRGDATHWIQLKHTGENKGVGVVNWDSESVARFNRQFGKPDPALQIVEFVRNCAVLDETTKKNLEDIRLTNIGRLVADPDVRAALGIRVDKGDVITDLPLEEVRKGLTKIVTDVANGNIKVKTIYRKEDRQEYVGTFKPNEIPSNRATVGEWTLQSMSSSVQSGQTGNLNETRKRSKSLATSRKRLIPPSCILKISHHRINKIYHELRLLDVDSFPNAVAVMLRVFLELSLDEYVKSKPITLPKEPKLSQKLERVADYLESNRILDKNELKSIRVGIHSKHALWSTDTLHAYIHNKDFAPKASDLKDAWDTMQRFFEAIWQ